MEDPENKNIEASRKKYKKHTNQATGESTLRIWARARAAASISWSKSPLPRGDDPLMRHEVTPGGNDECLDEPKAIHGSSPARGVATCSGVIDAEFRKRVSASGP